MNRMAVMSLSKYTPKHTTTTGQNSKVNVKKKIWNYAIFFLCLFLLVFSSKLNICESSGKIVSGPNMCHQPVFYSMQNIYPCTHDKMKDRSDAMFHTQKETILGTTRWNLCYAGGRSLTVSYKLPSYFGGFIYHHVGLIFSRTCPLRKQAVWSSGKGAGMRVRRELASVASYIPLPLTRTSHLWGLHMLYLYNEGLDVMSWILSGFPRLKATS